MVGFTACWPAAGVVLAPALYVPYLQTGSSLSQGPYNIPFPGPLFLCGPLVTQILAPTPLTCYWSQRQCSKEKSKWRGTPLQLQLDYYHTPHLDEWWWGVGQGVWLSQLSVAVVGSRLLCTFVAVVVAVAGVAVVVVVVAVVV